MSDIKISGLPAAGPLDGGELIPVVQDGETRKTSIGNIIEELGLLSGNVPAARIGLVDLNGNDSTAEVGNAAKPFASAQAAYDVLKELATASGGYLLKLGIGVFNINLTADWNQYVQVGGQGELSQLTINANGTSGIDATAAGATGSNGTNGFNINLAANLDVKVFVNSYGGSGGRGGDGQQGANGMPGTSEHPDGYNGDSGGSGGHGGMGGNGGNIILTGVLNPQVHSVGGVGGEGGTAGIGGNGGDGWAGQEYSYGGYGGWNGYGGDGGNGGQSGTVTVIRCTGGTIYAQGGAGGNAGSQPYSYSQGGQNWDGSGYQASGYDGYYGEGGVGGTGGNAKGINLTNCHGVTANSQGGSGGQGGYSYSYIGAGGQGGNVVTAILALDCVDCVIASSGGDTDDNWSNGNNSYGVGNGGNIELTRCVGGSCATRPGSNQLHYSSISDSGTGGLISANKCVGLSVTLGHESDYAYTSPGKIGDLILSHCLGISIALHYMTYSSYGFYPNSNLTLKHSTIAAMVFHVNINPYASLEIFASDSSLGSGLGVPYMPLDWGLTVRLAGCRVAPEFIGDLTNYATTPDVTDYGRDGQPTNNTLGQFGTGNSSNLIVPENF